MSKKTRNNRIRIVILLICTILLIVSLGEIIYYAKDYVMGRSDYRQAEELFSIPDIKDLDPLTIPEKVDTDTPKAEDPAVTYFKDCDFDALTAVNPEVVGWIVIPNTNISYPICQHEDNDYYLHHTYRLEANRIGAIFLDYRVSPDFSDFNTIVYGHRLRDQTMFSALKTFREKSTWEENPYILVCTPTEVLVYKIYAAYSGDPDGLSYTTKQNKDDSKQQFIDYTLRCAEYNTGVVPTVSDRIITLSTCIGTNHTHRMIINGVLIRTATR